MLKKAFGQKSEWEFCLEAFLLHSRRQLYVPPVFPCFQAFATSGCADVQSVLWHATAAPAIVNPADNRKEMFIEVSEPVHLGLHLPSAACGVKKGCLIFSSFFYQDARHSVLYSTYERGSRISDMQPQPFRQAACRRRKMFEKHFKTTDS